MPISKPFSGISHHAEIERALDGYHFSIRSQYPVFPAIYFEGAMHRYMNNPYVQYKKPGLIFMLCADGITVWIDEERRAIIEDTETIEKISEDCKHAQKTLEAHIKQLPGKDLTDINEIKKFVEKVTDLYRSYGFFADENFLTSDPELLEALPHVRLEVSAFVIQRVLPVFDSILQKISVKTAFSEAVLKKATLSELERMLNGESVTIDKKRNVAVVATHGKVVMIHEQDHLKRLEERLHKDDRMNEKETSAIKGTCARSGIVRGRVVILKATDYHNVKSILSGHKGYILVTPMTRPELVPYMKDAIAFVTDEGGITCHAAIVAREMQKPCIIGTKVATRVLKDGDEVEVDADKGIVRILKRLEETSASTPVTISPGENVFRWGPIPGRVYYVSEFLTECAESLYKRFGYSWPETLMLFHEGRMVWMNDFPTLQKVGGEIFQKHMLDEKQRMSLYREWQEATNVLTAVQKKMDATDFASLSDGAFLALWDDYYKKVTMFWTPTIPPELGNYGADVLLEAELARYIPHNKERKDAMEALTAPEEPSFYQEEESELLKTQDFVAHAQRYSWLKNSYGGVRVLGEEFFRERKPEIPKGFDARATERLKEVQEKKAACIKKYNLPDSIKHMAETIVKNIEWQDERKKYIFINLQYKHILLEEVARRTGNDIHALLDVFWDEVPDIVRTKRRIEPRAYRGFHGTMQNVAVLDDAAAKKYWDIFAQEKASEGIKEFSGIVASPGKATGNVRILLDPEQSTFQDGEILVAPMTSPEYVFAMKKSAAILTDTGGLTSHAAIVARELKKPCLVGTKIATSALKDGDLVEVNAEKGIVRILVRA